MIIEGKFLDLQKEEWTFVTWMTLGGYLFKVECQLTDIDIPSMFDENLKIFDEIFSTATDYLYIDRKLN